MLLSTKFQNVHIIVTWCTQSIYNLQSRSWLHMSTIRTDGNYLKMFLLVRPKKTMKRRSQKKTELQLESFLRYIQNSWSFLRELIGKSPMKISYLLHKTMVSKNETLGQKQIATEFNTFSANVWPKLDNKIP